MNKSVILIVDDEPMNLHALAAILKTENTVIVATNGTDALRLATERQPDLILLDVLMPGMDGRDVCKTLKADPRTSELPVIFVTALDNTQDVVAGFQMGAVDYISKPYEPVIVQARVRNHLEQKRLKDQLRNIAMTDGLTGIPNRRRFDEMLELEWRRCLRHQMPMSVALCDVDYFKKYNDTYGHQAGDSCLQMVAETMRNTVSRAGDLIARYGGEEFVLLLPDTPHDGAILLAETLCRAVEARSMPHEASLVSLVVTISVGVATVIPAADVSPDKIVGLADTQLYLAKQGGRNRVHATEISPEQVRAGFAAF